MNKVVWLTIRWLAVTSCGAATGLEGSGASARDVRSDAADSGGVSSEAFGGQKPGSNQAEFGGTMIGETGGSSGVRLVAGTTGVTTGGSNTGSTTPPRDCSRVANDGGGGAHTVAFEACCQCGWPAEGPLCQAVLQILPFSHSSDDELYYRCIGGEVPFCILDHLDTCAAGFPMECFEAYAAQVACISQQ